MNLTRLVGSVLSPASRDLHEATNAKRKRRIYRDNKVVTFVERFVPGSHNLSLTEPRCHRSGDNYINSADLQFIYYSRNWRGPSCDLLYSVMKPTANTCSKRLCNVKREKIPMISSSSVLVRTQFSWLLHSSVIICASGAAWSKNTGQQVITAMLL